MVVAYYTSTHYLDVILETIQSIKNDVELHVFIEVTPSSKNTTIIDVESLEPFNFIETPERFLGSEKWKELKKYFEGVANVKFIVHKGKRGLSFSSLSKAYSLGRYLKKYHVDVFHFDSVSTRSIGLYPYLKGKKVFISIHDPVPHSGENNWRHQLLPFVFYKMAKGYFFYSSFACQQFRDYYKKIKAGYHVIKLQPYSFITQFLPERKTPGTTILFFGRLSYYKGIDLLLDAIPIILKKYPDEQFMIAGKPEYGYKMDDETVNLYKNNVSVLARYLSIDELVAYIQDAKFIVCPYRDATQSGVVMTALAMRKMVVATDVGSFSEYIKDDENGFLAAPDAQSIADKMLEALKDNRYLEIERDLDPCYSEPVGKENGQTLLKAYRS